MIMIFALILSLNIVFACKFWDDCQDAESRQGYLLNQQDLDKNNLERARGSLISKWNDELAKKYLIEKEKEGISSEDIVIAERFFTEKNNLQSSMSDNSLKRAFEMYYNKKTQSVIVLNGELEEYNPPYFITREGNRLKNFLDIPPYSTITINEDGSISICKTNTKCAESRFTLKGSIDYNGQYDSYDLDGEFNGNKIKQGKNLKFDKYGNIVSGAVKSFETETGKITFAEEHPISYKEGTIILSGVPEGSILDIEGSLKIAGRDVELPYGDKLMRGEISYRSTIISKIGQESEVIALGVKHITKDKELNVFFASSKEEANNLAKENRNNNYFIYWNDAIWIGGNRFSSEIVDIVDIYEDPKLGLLKKLVFSPQNGYLSINRVSRLGRPLALSVNAEGSFEIENGKYIFLSDGKQMYARVDSSEGANDRRTEFFSGSDMGIRFLDDDGNSKIYDLDVDKFYRPHLTDKRREELNKELEDTNNQIISLNERLAQEMKVLRISEEQVKDKFEQLRINDKEIMKLEYDIFELERELNSNPRESRRTTILQEIEQKKSEIEMRKNKAEQIFKQVGNVRDLIMDVRNLQYDKGIVEEQLSSGLEAGHVEGIFAQRIKSEDGKSALSYSQFIEGFPIIKNDEQMCYFGFSPDGECAASYQKGKFIRLNDPRLVKENVDVLELSLISHLQTCADTQIRLYGDYQFERYKNKEISDFSFRLTNNEEAKFSSFRKQNPTHPDEESYRNYILYVMNNLNSGGLSKNLKDTNIQDLKPGDIITLHPDPISGYGHTMGILNKIESPPASGNYYFTTFEGTDPATNTIVNKKLLTTQELESLSKKYDYTVISSNKVIGTFATKEEAEQYLKSKKIKGEIRTQPFIRLKKWE